MWVVPHGRIAAWLLARPLVPMPVAPATLAVQLSARHPSATEPTSWPVEWTGKDASPETGTVSRSTGTRRAGSSRRQGVGKVIVAAVAGVLALTLLPHLIGSLGQAAGKKIATQLATDVSWKPPCGALPTPTLAKDLGRPLYSYGPPEHEVCRWSFSPKPVAGRPADLALETGWFAQSELGHTSKAGFVQGKPALRLQIPQHVRVPGSLASKPGVVQPMVISLVVGRLSPAAARKAMTAIAGQLADRLPTGPGTTIVKYR